MNENLAHMQYLPGDPRLVDQLVYELKSKGIFDQFRKECIADVDTRPAYQNLRQRVETSVATFLSRQTWQPDLNKNQLREKLRKHLLDGNYLEQGVERIVDQVVNPKVASVFIPQVEDVVYNYLGIPRKKKVETETSQKIDNDLLPTDLEAVSPGSVKSNDDKIEAMDISESQEASKMETDDEKSKLDVKEDSVTFVEVIDNDKNEDDSKMSIVCDLVQDSNISIDKSEIPLPEEIKLENIPEPENSPPKINSKDIDLEKIDLPKEPNPSTDIPLPDEMPKIEMETYCSKETIISTVISSEIPLPDDVPRIEKSEYFKPLILNSEDDESSSDSSLRRNMSMSPLTPIRNFNNENSYDAQQAFENDSDGKSNDLKEPSTFRFTIEAKSSENSCDKPEKKDTEQNLSYKFNNQVNINAYNTPAYEDSSNSNNLQIDYESDANSKATTATEIKAPEPDQNSVDSKKERKSDDKKSSHKSSHRSRDSHRHSSSKDKRSDSKQSSRDSSRYDKKPSSSSKEDKSKSNKDKPSDKSDKPSDKGDKPSDKGDKKDSKESSKHKSSSSHKSSSHKESSSHRDSTSKHRSSSSRHSSSSKHDDKKSSSSHRDKDKEKSSSDKSKDRKSRDSKSSSSRSEKDKDRKSSSSRSKHDDKENKDKKEKKDTDDHYSLSGRGNHTRRSTDRDSNDGSSSSKGSHNPSNKTSESKKDAKTSSKSGHTSSATDSTSPSDREVVPGSSSKEKTASQTKPIVRVETRLENQILSPPRLPFVPDVTLKKPKFAANFEEAKRMMKMRKFLADEQKRMNQEAALLLEFQANVRPSLSQVYSSIPGPELEFACGSNSAKPIQTQTVALPDDTAENVDVNAESVDEDCGKDREAQPEEPKDSIAETLTAMDLEHNEADNSQANNEQSLESADSVNVESKDTILATLTNDGEDMSEVVLPELDTEHKQVVIIELKPSDADDKDQGSETEYFEVMIITEESSESQDAKDDCKDTKDDDDEEPLSYFAEHDKYNAEIERDRFTKFYKSYSEKLQTNKMYLLNCDTYEENLIREVAENFGKFEIINYHKNGHLTLLKSNKNIVKNVNIAEELALPTKNKNFESPRRCVVSPVIFSPVKSECSFELSSDYDAKLEEMVSKTSRQEIMEIIFGGGAEGLPSEMPTIDYCMESSIETENNLKRKISEVESTDNNNGSVLTANKMRKLSESDQITSTTEESEEPPNNRIVTKSKFLGKARRVGLPKPKKSLLPSSPSSDKSVENYEENAPQCTPNGKIKTVRNKVQRYDTSDLYKPKLHYLSRRNNVT